MTHPYPLLTLLILLPLTAHAEPPLPGTEDYEVLMPHSAWMQRQVSPTGELCCSVADGRPVSVRQTPNGYEALITKEKFGLDAPDDWVLIPDSAVLRIPNPIGQDVAWYYHGAIRCFVFGSRT